MTLELKTSRAVIFHLDYSEKACQDHATLVIFNNSLEAGSQDPIFASDFYLDSKMLLQIFYEMNQCQISDRVNQP